MIGHRWSGYEVTPEESVYALAIASINYTRFERTHVWMLCAIANMPEEQAVVFSSRTNPPDRIRIMEVFLKRREWPEQTLTAIKHYLKAMEVLILKRTREDGKPPSRPGGYRSLGGTQWPPLITPPELKLSPHPEHGAKPDYLEDRKR
jgi:hypothetical protein